MACHGSSDYGTFHFQHMPTPSLPLSTREPNCPRCMTLDFEQSCRKEFTFERPLAPSGLDKASHFMFLPSSALFHADETTALSRRGESTDWFCRLSAGAGLATESARTTVFDPPHGCGPVSLPLPAPDKQCQSTATVSLDWPMPIEDR